MKVKAVIKKIEKALGVKVSHPERDGGYYCVNYDGHVLSWHSNGTGGLEAEAAGYHVRREDDHSEPQTDYFAGYSVDNPTRMIHAVKPPPPKFKTGALIRFKDNKRSKRYGINGKLGIVMQAGGSGMCRVRLNGALHHHLDGQDTFHERDLELAKSNL